MFYTITRNDFFGCCSGTEIQTITRDRRVCPGVFQGLMKRATKVCIPTAIGQEKKRREEEKSKRGKEQETERGKERYICIIIGNVQMCRTGTYRVYCYYNNTPRMLRMYALS